MPQQLIVLNTIHNSQDVETISVSLNWWKDKENMAHLYSGILVSLKKEQNNVFCNTMDAPRDCHTKSEKKDKYNTILLICEI